MDYKSINVGISFNGRTVDFDSTNVGSIPTIPTNKYVGVAKWLRHWTANPRPGVQTSLPTPIKLVIKKI